MRYNVKNVILLKELLLWGRWYAT